MRGHAGDDELFSLGRELGGLSSGQHGVVEADPVRSGLLAMDALCSVTYADGRIALRIDRPELGGAHVRRAIELVAVIARTRMQTTAYRS